MTNPRHYLFLTFFYLLIVMGICLLLSASLKTAFMANWGFNLIILAALCVGIGINIFQIQRLEPEIKWLKIFRTGDPGLSVTEPVLLAPIAKHLKEIHRDHFRLSALSLQTVLDGIRGHLDESREISKYMISLLVFLGLLGTFWGLLQTIGTVGQVISGLDVGAEDFINVVTHLKQGLEEPLKEWARRLVHPCLGWAVLWCWDLLIFRQVMHRTGFLMKWKSGCPGSPDWLIQKKH